MTWCNLSLTESKYKLTLIHSRLAQYCLIAECVLLMFLGLLLSVIFFDFYLGTYQHVFTLKIYLFNNLSVTLIAIILVLLSGLICGYFYFARQVKINVLSLSSSVAEHGVKAEKLIPSNLILFFQQQAATGFVFELSESGILSFGVDNQWRLMPLSRISFFGCYLFLEKLAPLADKPEQPLKKTLRKKRVFLFKDNLSAQDYARLTRVINKIKRIDSL